MINLKPLTATIKVVSLVLMLSTLQNVNAHIDPANHHINTATCNGILYRSANWSIASSSREYHQSVAVCNSPTPEDNCGQFDLAVNYGDNFCATQTQSMTNALLHSSASSYYYSPQNLVLPRERSTYRLSQDMNFSCNVCAITEQIHFENGDNTAKTSFLSGEPVFIKWNTNSTYPSNAPYSQYTIKAANRPIGSSASYQPFATLVDSHNAFGMINLVDALYNFQNQRLQFAACYEYEITLSVKANHDNKFFYSKHHFRLYDQAACPETANSAITDPSELGTGPVIP